MFIYVVGVQTTPSADQQSRGDLQKPVPEIAKVHDAYIIAVEENARKKLEDLSINHKVVPVDMTRPPSYREEGVTSFRAEPCESKKKETLVQQVEQEEEIHLVDPIPENSLSMPVAEKQRKAIPWGSSGGSVNGSIEGMEMNGVMEKEGPRKGKGGKGKKEGRVNKAHSNPDTLLIEDLVGRGKLSSNGKASSHDSLNHSSHEVILYGPDSNTDFQHSGQNSFEYSDSGPHREMAIDCPDSFIGAIKTPPKYPPPSQTSSNTAVPSSGPRVPPTTPNKMSDSMKDKTKTDNTLSDAAALVTGSQHKPTVEQLERLRKHQEDLRKRREEESRQQQEQEFLRVSLRGSKKLQALENRKMAPDTQAPPTGFVNTAYVDAEDDYEAADDVDGVPLSQVQPRERYLKKNAGIEDLLSTLHHIRNRLNTGDNTSSSAGGHQVTFLKTLFHNPQFQQAVIMHQKMVDITSRSPHPRPVRTDARELFMEVRSASPSKSNEPAMKELIQLLSKPHMKNLLKAHDEVAERESQPILHSQDSELDYPLLQHGEDSVKIIHLEKTNEHLGATVKNEGDSVIVARIVTGGAAEKSGLLHEGDEILEVNGIDMRGKNVNEVSEILANMSGTITFMIIPGHCCVEPPPSSSDAVMHLRAMFNYDPEEDPYIPCRELGISFLKGDILHAIQLSDLNWWQAHREGEEEQHSLAGLIPSRSFQEQRETVRRQLQAESKENKKRNRVCACGRKERKKKKKKKSLYSAGVSEEAEEILTYEEVTRYYPQPNHKRPIVLIGPPDVGRQELRNRLMQWDCDRFAFAVPHTSRAPEPGEQPGKEYHFITRSVFEADILSGKFLEYGEYQNNLYGTSFQAVRQVINEGKQCILNLEPESLKVLRNTDLKPYAVFICPPNLEKLQQLHLDLGKHRPTDEKLKEIIEKGREMEEMYGHLFDVIIVNMDIERTFEELKQEIFRIDNEPQWVPLHWLDNSIM
ncbi:MAGUK p55 subfamily member 5-like isoform X4 [Pomacea canaliculata]|uniref:MAGUK p55 subfamily member 5-like isoform X4 n=1 Tax=Pomacea canaliculata TaxID=400727 RepID=UPI000D733FD5|nr:MAGUK p55 subfamily member 5-like isoform X4 [Pomacea canaliculata]